MPDHLRVWVDDRPVGRLARHGRGASFIYDTGVDPTDAVSLIMPVRAPSFDVPSGLPPVFDMNLPEGFLLDRIRRALAKDDSGRVDPLDVLALTGGNQIGRLRLLPEGVEPERRDPIGDIGDFLKLKSNGPIIALLLQTYALRSGVSGAMPKILVEDAPERRATIQTRDWILKFDAPDYPHLSLVEHHCLEAARAAGNATAETWLSDDGRMLAVRRFDEEGGRRLGFEDFAALTGRTSQRKYEGSLEAVAKTAGALTGPAAQEVLTRLYRRFVTSIALRDGDAHLKNLALLYRDARGPAWLAPAYDIVTTVAFPGLEEDLMALSLDGTKRWPGREALLRFGARCRLRPAEAASILEEVATGIAARLPAMREDLSRRGAELLAGKLEAAWRTGVERSFGLAFAAPESAVPVCRPAFGG